MLLVDSPDLTEQHPVTEVQPDKDLTKWPQYVADYFDFHLLPPEQSWPQ